MPIVRHFPSSCAKVVLFQDGSKVMHLEGGDAARVTVDELQEILEDAWWHYWAVRFRIEMVVQAIALTLVPHF